jgi:molybdate transport system substrate-binding protein
LQKLGLWDAVEPKLAMVGNVRAALVLVARGEAPLGIVYATDAKVEPAVKVIAAFPEDSHEPIVYPAAATRTAKPAAALYLAFLRSATGRAIFETYGFRVLIKSVS